MAASIDADGSVYSAWSSSIESVESIGHSGGQAEIGDDGDIAELRFEPARYEEGCPDLRRRLRRLFPIETECADRERATRRKLEQIRANRRTFRAFDAWANPSGSAPRPARRFELTRVESARDIRHTLRHEYSRLIHDYPEASYVGEGTHATADYATDHAGKDGEFDGLTFAEALEEARSLNSRGFWWIDPEIDSPIVPEETWSQERVDAEIERRRLAREAGRQYILTGLLPATGDVDGGDPNLGLDEAWREDLGARAMDRHLEQEAEAEAEEYHARRTLLVRAARNGMHL